MAKAEYKQRKYNVQPYDPIWAQQFETEAKTLKSIFGSDAVAVEHIGSTAVPGMEGKPTIDILILVDDLSVANAHDDEMIRAGYEKLPNYVMPETVLFRRMEDNTLLSNVHIFKKDHPHVVEMIALRDYLRSHPEEVTKYSSLKKELFLKHPDDYGTYRKLKDEYMDDLKKRILPTSE